MYAISDIYKDYLKKRSRTWLIKVNIAGADYGSNAIIDFEIENSLAPDDEFALGTAILSKLTIRMKTSDAIPPNARVIPYVALQLQRELDGTGLDGANIAWQDCEDTWETADYPWQGAVTEWLPLGEFYIDNREQINNVWEFVCYDKLVYADAPYISQLTYPTTMQVVWDEICTSLGYIYDGSVVINPACMIQAGPAGYTKRQVMGYIASANSASVYIGKNGVVRFRKFAAADTSVFDMTQSEYITAKRTNPEKTYTRIVVTYNTEDDLSYTAGSGDENHTLYVENPFATQSITNDLLVKLNGFSYAPVAIDARGYPQIEAGDRLGFGVFVDTPTWNTADTAWQDTEYSWTGYASGGQTIALHTVYSFRGGLKMAVEAPSKSEQQSEFKVDGTLTAAVNRLNKTAVKEGKSYFGATITRNEGLIVEREDHLSKLTLNSDVMDWQINGVSSLYFDAQAAKLKFKGDIVMEGGSISWSNVGAPEYNDIGGIKPPADADNTIGVIGPGRLTKITSTGVYTGTITAEQINANTLSAISANLGEVTAGKITGVTVQTAETGQRIIEDIDGLQSYDANGIVRIAISPRTTTFGVAGIEFRDENDNAKGHIFSNSSIFGLWGQNALNIQSIFGATTIKGPLSLAEASISGALNLSNTLLTLPILGVTFSIQVDAAASPSGHHTLTFSNGHCVGITN